MTAAVDIAAVAKRLSANQRTVLAGVAGSSVHRAYGSASYFMGGRIIAVTATARSLIRGGFVQPTDPGGTCVLTDLGRAVLDHLGERAS